MKMNSITIAYVRKSKNLDEIFYKNSNVFFLVIKIFIRALTSILFTEICEKKFEPVSLGFAHIGTTVMRRLAIM